jgi:hypothetical protein
MVGVILVNFHLIIGIKRRGAGSEILVVPEYAVTGNILRVKRSIPV